METTDKCIKQIVELIDILYGWLLSMMIDQSSETLLSPLPLLISEKMIWWMINLWIRR